MSADWIKIRSNIKDDPDVVDIASRIGMDEFSVVGRLHALWAWAGQHSCDGTLPRATSAFVDRLTACPGFAEALRQVGWLEGRDSALRLPNWDRHNGNTAKARAVEARKKQWQRDKCPDDQGTRAGPDKTRVEESRKDKRGESYPKNPPVAPKRESSAIADWTGLPAELATDGFRAKWLEYVAYRREKHLRPLGPRSIAEKWRELEALGAVKAIDAIRHSIANGWQGIFPPDQRNGTPASRGIEIPESERPKIHVVQ